MLNDSESFPDVIRWQAIYVISNGMCKLLMLLLNQYLLTLPIFSVPSRCWYTFAYAKRYVYFRWIMTHFLNIRLNVWQNVKYFDCGWEAEVIGVSSGFKLFANATFVALCTETVMRKTKKCIYRNRSLCMFVIVGLLHVLLAWFLTSSWSKQTRCYTYT